MVEFEKISEEAKTIVKECPTIKTCPTYEEFVISLYAMTSDADSRVLQELTEYRVDLSRTFSTDKIDVLLKEYRAVIRYCSEPNFHWWSNKSLSYILPNELINLCHSVVTDYCSPIVKNKFHRLFIWQHTKTDAKTRICGDVLFPFADDAQFAHALNDCAFDVNEPDSKSWAFGQILKDAYLRDSEIHLGDSFEKADGKMYDYVFSCPILRKDIGSVADELYNVAATCLKDNGIMCCLLPESFCYAPEWYGFRKILVDRKGQYSALVISLPDILQPYVPGNMCLFCLIKPQRCDELLDLCNPFVNQETGEVFFPETANVKLRETFIDECIDKVVLVNAKNNNFLEEPYDSSIILAQLQESSLSFPDFSDAFGFDWQLMLNTISRIRELVYSARSFSLGNNVNLLPSRYLVHKFSQYSSNKCIKLGEVIDLVKMHPHKPYNKGEEVRCLKSAFLSNDYLNCDIYCKDKHGTSRSNRMFFSKIFNDISTEILNLYELLSKLLRFNPDRVIEKCLLASYCEGGLKVGRVVDISCTYELSPEIIAFKVKSDKVSEEFLLRTLVSNDVAKQAMMLSWGGFYSSIDKEDFLQIEIVLPSKEEQERICREDVQKRLNMADRKLQESFEEFRKDLHMKRHAIGQTISVVNNWWSILQQVRKENGGALNDDIVVGNKKRITVGGIYDGLHNALSRLQQQIFRLDRGNGLNAEIFPLTEFIEEYINNHQHPLFEFEYNVEKHHYDKDSLEYHIIIDEETKQPTKVNDYKKGDPILKEYIKFPRQALIMILDNIISNACSHGFTDSSKENKVRIDFEYNDGYVVATVSNNGKPLHEEMTTTRVFLYGESTKNGEEHYGLGGYEIKNLMQQFGGAAEIESTPSEEFTVSYKLIFPFASDEHK